MSVLPVEGRKHTERRRRDRPRLCDASPKQARFTHIDPPTLLIEGRAELDQVKRREIYIEMQQIVHDDGGSVIPMFMSYVQAASTKIQLPDKMASNWELDGEKLAERWWFA